MDKPYYVVGVSFPLAMMYGGGECAPDYPTALKIAKSLAERGYGTIDEPIHILKQRDYPWGLESLGSAYINDQPKLGSVAAKRRRRVTVNPRQREPFR